MNHFVKDRLNNNFAEAFAGTGSSFNYTLKFYDPGTSLKWEAANTLVVCLILFIVSLNIIGTFYVYFSNEKTIKSTKNPLKYFSFIKNT